MTQHNQNQGITEANKGKTKTTTPSDLLLQQLSLSCGGGIRGKQAAGNESDGGARLIQNGPGEPSRAAKANTGKFNTLANSIVAQAPKGFEGRASKLTAEKQRDSSRKSRRGMQGCQHFKDDTSVEFRKINDTSMTSYTQDNNNMTIVNRQSISNNRNVSKSETRQKQ